LRIFIHQNQPVAKIIKKILNYYLTNIIIIIIYLPKVAYNSNSE